jgi:RNA polymerase sigma factor (sigma-70 family)
VTSARNHPEDRFRSIPGHFYSVTELLEWYQDTLRTVRKSYDSYTEQMQQAKDSAEYQRLEAERSVVSGMISDLEYCIEWMKTGRRPGNRRGVERHSYEQREVLKDSRWWNAYSRSQQGQRTLSDEELQMLDDLLGCLTKEQYEVFTMIRGRCFTYDECARELGMPKSTVQYHLERAEERLREKIRGGNRLELQGSLF